MKKAGAHFKNNDTSLLMIVILIIVVLFIVFIKPIYQFVGRLQSGALFEKKKETQQVQKNEEEQYHYVTLTPEGAERTTCTKTISDAGGDKKITVVLYHTANNLQSITVEYKYSGMTNEYSNYMFLAQSQFKEKKVQNVANDGYSMDYKLSGNTLVANEIYLLNKTTIKKTGSYSETNDIVGELDQDIYTLKGVYTESGYRCEGENE